MKQTLIVMLLLVAAVVCNAQAAVPPPVPVHGVTLSWTTVTGVTGYVVWRGGTTGGPYIPLTMLATSNITCVLNTCTWQDSNVTAGATYFYVVTSVLNAGTLTLGSVYSGEVSATIPADPVPPVAPAKAVITPK